MAPPQKYLTRDEFFRLLKLPQVVAAVFPVNLSDPTQTSGDLPFSRLVQASTDKLVIGRKSSGSGDWEECTLSEILDFITSAAQGDILYRGSSAWARLPADTDGKVLTTHGASADPTWETPSTPSASGLVLLESHTASTSSQLAFTTRNASGQSGDTFQSDFDEYLFEFINVLPASDGNLLWQVSTDNGSSYDSSGNYFHQHFIWRAGGSALDGQIPDTAAFLNYYLTSSIESTGPGASGTFRLYDPLGSGHKLMFGTLRYTDTGPFRVRSEGDVGWESSTAVNACRFYVPGLNIASGTIRCYGLAK